METSPTIDKSVITDGLKDFYNHYIVETVNGSFQVFQSFTYGEMAICLLLSVLVLMFALKWFWEVIH